MSGYPYDGPPRHIWLATGDLQIRWRLPNQHWGDEIPTLIDGIHNRSEFLIPADADVQVRPGKKAYAAACFRQAADRWLVDPPATAGYICEMVFQPEDAYPAQIGRGHINLHAVFDNRDWHTPGDFR